MKITLVKYLNSIGPIERFLIKLGAEAKKQGHEVEILLLFKAGVISSSDEVQDQFNCQQHDLTCEFLQFDGRLTYLNVKKFIVNLADLSKTSLVNKD